MVEERCFSWPSGESILSWLFGHLASVIDDPRRRSSAPRPPYRGRFASPDFPEETEGFPPRGRGDYPAADHSAAPSFDAIQTSVMDECRELVPTVPPARPGTPSRRSNATPPLLHRLKSFFQPKTDYRANWEILNQSHRPGFIRAILPVGAFRRRQSALSRLELVTAVDSVAELADYFSALPTAKNIVTPEPGRIELTLVVDAIVPGLRQVPLIIHAVRPEEFLTTALFETCGIADRAALIKSAAERGMTLDRSGLYSRGRRIFVPSFEAFFEQLGLENIPAERLDSGYGFPQRGSASDRLVTLDDLQGDLHMHTTYSDGSGTVEEMIAEAMRLGHRYIALTDHTERCYTQGGMDTVRFRQYWRRIDQINRQFASMGNPFRILKGAEVDILPDGSLDMERDLLAMSDWIIASIHFDQVMPREQIHRRIESALANPYVCAIAHPTFRTFTSDFRLDLDPDFLIDRARTYGKFLEINSQPRRLDLDETLSRRAKDHGVRLVISTDSHAPHQLGCLRYGVNVARRAGLTPKDVLNTLSLQDLMAVRNEIFEYSELEMFARWHQTLDDSPSQ
ncbi:MAG: PHP domain-containing protein [Thermoguttaceae bacterium]|nr:PHP domain-containing protein [Thermoguttaceae bacterium]